MMHPLSIISVVHAAVPSYIDTGAEKSHVCHSRKMLAVKLKLSNRIRPHPVSGINTTEEMKTHSSTKCPKRNTGIRFDLGF